MTIASPPQRLPAIANPLLASESLIRSVSGLLLTTANFRRRGQRAADEWTEGEDERRLGRERIDGRSAFVEQNPGAETAAAEALAQNRFRERTRSTVVSTHRSAGNSRRIPERRGTLMRRVHDGDVRGVGFSQASPASADMIRTQSSVPASGVRGSLTNAIAVQVGGERRPQPIGCNEPRATENAA